MATDPSSSPGMHMKASKGQPDCRTLKGVPSFTRAGMGWLWMWMGMLLLAVLLGPAGAAAVEELGSQVWAEHGLGARSPPSRGGGGWGPGAWW